MDPIRRISTPKNRISLYVSLLLFCALFALTGCMKPSYHETMKEGMKEYETQRTKPVIEQEYSQAVGMFKMASDIDGERPEPSYHMGLCYMAMADKQFAENDLPGALRYCDRAVSQFGSAVSAFPGYSLAAQGKAAALKLKGKHAAALEIANWVAAQSAFESKKLIVEARQYAEMGDLDNAQLALQKATKVEPKNAAAHAELGLFYMRIKNDPEAIKALQRAYELQPRAPGVLQALVQLGAVPEYPN